MRFEYGLYAIRLKDIGNPDIDIDSSSYAKVLPDLIPSLTHLLIVTPVRDANSYVQSIYGVDFTYHRKAAFMRILRNGGSDIVIQKLDEREFPTFWEL